MRGSPAAACRAVDHPGLLLPRLLLWEDLQVLSVREEKGEPRQAVVFGEEKGRHVFVLLPKEAPG